MPQKNRRTSVEIHNDGHSQHHSNEGTRKQTVANKVLHGVTRVGGALLEGISGADVPMVQIETECIW